MFMNCQVNTIDYSDSEPRKYAVMVTLKKYVIAHSWLFGPGNSTTEGWMYGVQI